MAPPSHPGRGGGGDRDRGRPAEVYNRDRRPGDGPEMAQARQASQVMEANLNSTIGMGIARDPMVGHSGGSRLRFKHEKQDTSLINGYALVDDTEGEPPEPPAPVNVAPVIPRAPMGRGRGTTLPAWMTNQESAPGPTKDTDKRSLNDDDSLGRRHRKKKEKSKRKDRKKHSSRKTEKKRSRREHSSDDEEDGDRHRSRRRKDYRHSRSDSQEERSRRRHRDVRNGEDKSDNDGERTRSGKEHRGQYSDDSDDGVQFQSVEEAKKLIEQIAAKRKESPRKRERNQSTMD